MTDAVANRGRLVALATFLALWALVCAGRLVQVGVVRRGEFRSRAARQQERKLQFQPKRGEILDAEGRELAVSVEASSIFAVPPEVENPVATARALAPALGVRPLSLLEKLRDEKDFVYLARKVDHDTAERIRALGLQGIHFLWDPLESTCRHASLSIL